MWKHLDFNDINSLMYVTCSLLVLIYQLSDYYDNCLCNGTFLKPFDSPGPATASCGLELTENSFLTAKYHPESQRTWEMDLETWVIDRTKQDGDWSFYHNTLRTLHSHEQPIDTKKAMYFGEIISVVTTLCIVGLELLKLFSAFLRAFWVLSRAKNCG